MSKQVIICVDDEPIILKSLKAELKDGLSSAYLIETAEGGEEALELIKELIEDGYEIPVIITDYVMPDMKGDELLKQVHILSPNTLKIMLTGQATIEAVANVINYAKLYRYITKPWQLEDLKLTVKEAIDSYLKDQKLAEQNLKLQQMNQELAQLNSKQTKLITQLYENENRLTQFLDAMPVGVAVTDSNNQLYYMNHKAKELFNTETYDVSFDDISEFHQGYSEGANQRFSRDSLPIMQVLKGKQTTTDYIEINQNNKIIPLEVWRTPIYDQSQKIVYSIVAFQDISELKKAEAERQTFIEELFELNCNLELALEAELNLTNAAQRFVPNEFISLLGYQSLADVKLGEAVEQEMSILFSDIRSFTTISESMTPKDNFNFINAYLSHMEPAIIENHGFIDKYIGDAIMALFSGEADNAVKAGISMLRRLVEYNQYRLLLNQTPIKVGMGINTGTLMLGTVGGQSRMDTTVISDAVNLASRLETLTKKYEVPLLISHNTLAQLQNPMDYSIRLIEQIKVKGKSKAVAVFEVFDVDKPEIKAAKLATKTKFEEGLLLFYGKSFQDAEKLFQSILRINPLDQVTKIYWERCKMLN